MANAHQPNRTITILRGEWACSATAAWRDADETRPYRLDLDAEVLVPWVGAPACFAQALALLRAPSVAGGRGRNEDVFGTIAGGLETGDDATLLVETLGLALTARDDVNAWWDLPRLMRALARRMSAYAAPSGLAALCERAAQRPDCRDAVAEIRAALAPAHRARDYETDLRPQARRSA